MIRIGLADDHQLFRKSLRLVLQTFSKVKVIFEAADGAQALKHLTDSFVDIVLLDIQMPVMDGYTTCKNIRRDFPDVKILIISQLTSRESIHRVMECGAHGFFSKDDDPDQLEKAINTVNEKGYYFGTDLGSVLREAILWEEQNKRPSIITEVTLSDREIEVIRFASKEFSSLEIADLMNINVRTVETHRKRIMEKTNCKNFIGVILLALKKGWIRLEEL